MAKSGKAKRTLVGDIADAVLAFTVGKDPELDRVLVEADCIGTAAHVTMLSDLPMDPPLLPVSERERVVDALVDIMASARAGRFRIRTSDQDVHLALERELTLRLGETGRRVHTGRSRNDQVAVDLRLYGRERLWDVMESGAALANVLLRFARRHERVPMVGRTHQQPGMPSSVGLWASAFAEGLLDDAVLLRAVYDLTDRSPLGSAAGYGVPLPIDRRKTAALLGFARPIHNVLHASQTRGKWEGAVLQALAQVMVTLSRLSRDLILYSMPEFGYFSLPVECCTGSSIMPQKQNPDVLELVRAKAARLQGDAAGVLGVTGGIPGGYNRDLQETKEALLRGLDTTVRSLRIMEFLVTRLRANPDALRRGFRPEVFATDRVLERVAAGESFRDAYTSVREHLDELETSDADEAVRRKTHLGAPAGLDLAEMRKEVRATSSFAKRARRRYYARISKLLGVPYPELQERRSPG